MDDYDTYHLWLGIPPEEQPPSHYHLLGLRLFEENPEVIRNAADRQRAHVKRLGVNQYQEVGQKLLNEIEVAKLCLLKPEKRTVYDEALRASLLSRSENNDGTRSTLEEQLTEETLIVGSDHNCDIVIDLPIISGVHCSVMRRQDRVILRDLKSTNGTYVNFERVVRPIEITPADLVILGRDTRLKLPHSFFPSHLRTIRASFVGRSDQCEVWLNDHTVSAFHARLLFDGDGVKIEDLGSTNGTRLLDANGAGRRLQPKSAIDLERFSEVVFGKHRMPVETLKTQSASVDTTVRGDISIVAEE
jgi:pSer/pThr/pTyr-binding forkhead associated (FHA) protein